VCVCVCVRERERGCERESVFLLVIGTRAAVERGGQIERCTLCVCVCALCVCALCVCALERGGQIERCNLSLL